MNIVQLEFEAVYGPGYYWSKYLYNNVFKTNLLFLNILYICMKIKIDCLKIFSRFSFLNKLYHKPSPRKTPLFRLGTPSTIHLIDKNAGQRLHR